MDTYPCPACGGVANESDGCRSCGRAHDPAAAALARLNQAMAGLDDETRRLAEDQYEVRARRQRLEAERTALTQALAKRLAEEKGTTTRTHTTVPGQRFPQPPPRAPGVPAPADDLTAETSPRSAQNTLLTLGGVLVGIGVIVMTWISYTTAQTGGRAVILAITTTIALGFPILLARRTLTATAETIAGLGLLLVLLDGYAAYSANLAGLGVVPRPLYAAVLFALVAGVAAAYRFATHLRAPQFAALLAVQPLLPLIAVQLDLDRDGFAAIFALVAALNLGAVVLLGRDLGAILRVRGPASGSWPRLLRELAWILFGATLAISVSLVVVGLARADTVGSALRTSFVLLLAAAVGVAGGQLSSKDNLRQLASGAAALAIVAAVSRVNALALPQYTLVLTAAVAAAIAIAAGALPEPQRQGPQLGSLVGAALAALVVAGSAVGTATSAVRATITPQPWNADITRYVERVQATSWQVPVAAVLLTVLAVAAMPARWRIDAAAVGGTFIVLAAPGTGGVAWWQLPLFAAAVCTAATVAALYAVDSRSALIRSTVAGLLGVYALATSLARPELTAAVCAILALVAATAAIVTAGWPERFGPYADRVADSAGGAAAFTLPIAVGTFAWIGGAQSRVLLPMTLLATAVGVLGAALSQVAARQPRTGSAGGALVAAVGCVALSIVVDGTTPVDIALAVLLLVAAVATTASRAFELSAGGLIEGATAVPAAVSALADSVDGVIDRPEPVRRRRRPPPLDGLTLGSALGTAALVFAMARLLAVAVPGIGLVTTTAMVFVTSVAVLALPEAWRRGPRLGAGAVGGIIVLVTAGVALTEGARTLAASGPFWAADLFTWPERVAAFAPYGWQVPASLLLAAAAAWALLPAPNGGDVGYVTLALAGLAAPAAYGFAWWSPMLITGTLAAGAGVRACLGGRDEPPAVARRRMGFAFLLGLYATAIGAATPGSTAMVLSGIVAAGVGVAAIAQARGRAVPALVPGLAAAASLLAAPGAAATIAVATGATRTGILAAALSLTAFGVLVVGALRMARVRWGAYPAGGVGASALIVALIAVDPRAADPQGQLWAASAALVAVLAAATLRPPVARPAPLIAASPLVPPAVPPVRGVPDLRPALAVIVGAAAPAAVLAAIASAPAWLTALVGPYRTLRQIWAGYAVAPVPTGARTAMLTLLLLAGVAAVAALTLGGERFLLAATLPPLACLALVVPPAVGLPRAATSWVALAVALATGLGAALSPPTLPSAARLLRGTAGVVCAVTGAAGLAGSLATRTGTIASLCVLLAAAFVAATFGRDPAVRMVAWLVASGSGFALPITVLAVANQPLRPAAFGLLAICGMLVGGAWALGRIPARRAEAAVVELCAAIGAMLSLLLALGSARHAAAVLTIWGLLLGAAALRRDRPATRRTWLVRAALAAELGACWLLLYSVEVGLPEAYTLPFAALALLAGALELRRPALEPRRPGPEPSSAGVDPGRPGVEPHRPDTELREPSPEPRQPGLDPGQLGLELRPAGESLSSWTAYGAALAGGFLPSLALVLVGQDVVWRWVTLFAAAIATVIVGSWRRRQAPVVAGGAVAIVVAVTEMIRLLIAGAIAGAVLVAIAGIVLIAFGALSEKRLRGALRKMS